MKGMRGLILTLFICMAVSAFAEGNQDGQARSTSQDPEVMLTDGFYQYSFFAEGYGNYTYFFHFYKKDPVLGAVYYAGFANNQASFAGTYTVEKKDKAYAVYPDREAKSDGKTKPTEGTAPYTITFFDWDGKVVDSCGFDGKAMYNDMKKLTTATGANVVYSYDKGGKTSKNVLAYEGEVGVAYLDFINPYDETATLTLFHNGTYLDMMNMMVEGTWKLTKSGPSGNSIVLTPDEDKSKTVAITVTADKSSAIYAQKNQKPFTIVNKKLKEQSSSNKPSAPIHPVLEFKGGFCTFVCYDDHSFKFALESYNVEEVGTWAYDAGTKSFTITKSNGEKVKAAIDQNTQELSFDYVAVVSERLKDRFVISSDKWKPALTK